MDKYNIVPIKFHKARVEHICYHCENLIKMGEKIYYQSDEFLQSLSWKKFCEKCFNEKGQFLITFKKIQIRDKLQRSLLG